MILLMGLGLNDVSCGQIKKKKPCGMLFSERKFGQYYFVCLLNHHTHEISFKCIFTIPIYLIEKVYMEKKIA